MTINVYESSYFEKMVALNKYFYYYLKTNDIANAQRALYYMRVLIGKLSFKLYEYHQYINQHIASSKNLDNDYYNLGLLESFIHNCKILIEKSNSKLIDINDAKIKYEPLYKINNHVKQMVAKLKNTDNLYEKSRQCFLNKLKNIKKQKVDSSEFVERSNEYVAKQETSDTIDVPDENVQETNVLDENNETMQETNDTIDVLDKQNSETIQETNDTIDVSDNNNETIDVSDKQKINVSGGKLSKEYLLYFYSKTNTDNNLLNKLASFDKPNMQVVLINKDIDKDLVSHYAITTFPMLLLRKDDQVYKYHGKYNVDTILDNLNEVFNRTNPQKNIKFVLYYADWCPHCVKFKPIWEQLKNENLPITFEEVNAEKEPEKIEQAGVRGYPTMKLYKNGKVIDYDGARQSPALIAFLKENI